MKVKILSILVALALCLGLAVPAVPVAQAATSEAALAVAYKAYYDVLKAVVDEYGIGFTSDISNEAYEEAREQGEELEPSSSGVIYAELIDFENNGSPQLLLFYGSYGIPDYYIMSCDVYNYSVAGTELYGTYRANGYASDSTYFSTNSPDFSGAHFDSVYLFFDIIDLLLREQIDFW